MNIRAIRYLLLAIFVIVIDVCSKQWALGHCSIAQYVNPFFMCELTINRGISWSLFHTHNAYLFAMVTLAVGIIISMLMYHAAKKWSLRQIVVGEVMVIAGACSNMLDRFIYGGVIDFIVIHYKDWVWPTFNFADTAIVIGVLIMLITHED